MKSITTYITEKKRKIIDTATLREFIDWYHGRPIKKVTEKTLYDDLCWDYLADNSDLSLKEIAKLFNNNLDNEFDFCQEDIGNCISISWTIDNNNFEVDSMGFYGDQL